MSGRGRNKRYYEYDRTHGEIEVYNHRGEHLGAIDAETGRWVKDADPGRTIKL